MSLRNALRAGIPLGLVAMLSACASASAAPLARAAPVGHAELELRGDWTGVADADGTGVLDMAVSSAADDGTAFDGDLRFVVAGEPETESVHAAMTPLGHLVAQIGEDASIEMHIVDPATLDYCFVRYGFDPVHSCGRLVRQA